MDRWILTAICLAALAVAGSMAWRWHGLERLGHRSDEPPAGWAAARRALRSLAVMVNAGVIAGVLVGGFGGRLFMRIMAATSDDRVQGTLTEAKEPIGRVSTGGTIALLVFGGIFGGLLLMLLYRLLRPWLPAVAWKAGVLLGVIAPGAFGGVTKLLSRGNKDFDALSPTPLAAFMVVVGALFFGVVLVSIYERLDRGMADLSRWSIGVLAFVPLVFVSVMSLTLPAVVLVVLVAAFGSNFVRWWTTSPAVARVGQLVVGAALVGSVAVAATEIVAITT